MFPFFATPVGMAILLLLGLLWAYAPVLADLLRTWWSVADYSHGFFVVPLALYLAWSRRASFPPRIAISPWGMLPLIVALTMLAVGTRTFIYPLEQYSLVLAVAAVTQIIGGWPLLRWAAPMIAFLLFMIPLPHGVATVLAQPLQRVSALGAAYLVQAVGVPAIVQGTIIKIENADLNVAYACSGLQMIISFGAVATAIAMLSKYPLAGKFVIMVSAIPIAICVNVVRIALITWAQSYELVPPKQLHDAGGILVVPFTVALIFLGIFLFERCFPRRRRSSARHSS